MPQIGERKTKNGVTGEWDGTTWRQVETVSMAAAGPKVGDRKTKNGITGEWDGTTWRQLEVAPQAPQKQRTTLQIENMKEGFEGLKGIAKGAASTAVGLGRLIHQIPGVSSAVDALYGAAGVNVDSAADFGLKPKNTLASQVAPQMQASAESRLGLNPTNTAQKIGFAGEQMAEYFVPSGAALRATKALPVLRGASPLVQRMVAEGASALPVALAQGQSAEGAVATGTGAALMPAVAKVITGTAKGVTKYAFKPTQEALEINPNISQDILDEGIGLSAKGLKKASTLTDDARAFAESLVQKKQNEPAHFIAGPEGNFRSNRVNVKAELADPVFRSPEASSGGGKNAIGKVEEGFIKRPGRNTAAQMEADVLADNAPEIDLMKVLAGKRNAGTMAGKLWQGDTPDLALQKQVYGDIYNAADDALARRIGPQWGAANKETQRRLVNQKVVDDALGVSGAESHFPNAYDQYLLMRGVVSGDPVSLGIAMAREAGRVRPLVAAAGRGLYKTRKAPERAFKAGMGALSLNKAELDALYESYRNK
jgi:hypothetical protein